MYQYFFFFFCDFVNYGGKARKGVVFVLFMKYAVQKNKVLKVYLSCSVNWAKRVSRLNKQSHDTKLLGVHFPPLTNPVCGQRGVFTVAVPSSFVPINKMWCTWHRLQNPCLYNINIPSRARVPTMHDLPICSVKRVPALRESYISNFKVIRWREINTRTSDWRDCLHLERDQCRP